MEARSIPMHTRGAVTWTVYKGPGVYCTEVKQDFMGSPKECVHTSLRAREELGGIMASTHWAQTVEAFYPTSDSHIVTAARRAMRDGSKVLRFETFRTWYSILSGDHLERFETLVNSCNVDELKFLLTTAFAYTRSLGDKSSSKWDLIEWKVPFVLVAGFGSKKVFSHMMTCQGSYDLHTRDTGDSNVVHVIILGAHISKGLAATKSYITLYHTLMSYISLDDRRELLMQSNSMGLRPLELAAHLGQMDLFIEIFKEDNIYRYPVRSAGIVTEALYDVTDYETFEPGSRRQVSPLVQFLSRSSYKVLTSTETETLVLHPALLKWMHTKFWINIPGIAIWFIFRFIFCLSTIMATPSVPAPVNLSANTTDSFGIQDAKACPAPPPRNESMFLIMAFCSWLSVLFTLSDIIQHLKHSGLLLGRTRKPRGKIHINLTSGEAIFHSILIHFMTVLAITASTLHFFIKTPAGLNPVVPCLGIISTFSTWTILYFIQLLPHLGIYIICIFEMLSVLSRFLPLFCLVFMPFATSFKTFISGTAEFCNTKEFVRIVPSFYGTFQIMLNLLNPTDFVTTETMSMLPALHVLFVVFVPIMLLNCLIALMAEAMTKVIRVSDIRFWLHRTRVGLDVERRMGGLLKGVVMWHKRRFLVCREHRLCIRCFEVNSLSRDYARPETELVQRPTRPETELAQRPTRPETELVQRPTRPKAALAQRPTRPETELVQRLSSSRD